MRRTITMRDIGTVFYRGKAIGYLLNSIRVHFGLEDSDTHKYVIAITESKDGRYLFKNPPRYHMYELWDGNEYIDGICKCLFSKLFFKPGRKGYSITVEKVKIKRR